MTSTKIRDAVACLRDGGLVAFPTETVYGLGADIRRPEAVRRIFAAKGRPADRPLTLHLAPDEAPERWATWTDRAQRLAEACWPGPLTLVLPRTDAVPDVATAGGATVGLRVPAHPMAIELLRALGSAVPAPSANRSESFSPTTAEDVRRELGGRVDMVLDGGRCPGGLESTVLSLVEAPRVLRLGAISRARLEAILGCPVQAPGPSGRRMVSRTPVSLVTDEVDAVTRWGHLQRVGLLSRRDPGRVGWTWWRAPETPEGWAREFFHAVRRLDEAGCDRLLVQRLPDEPAWEASTERLLRLVTPSSDS